MAPNVLPFSRGNRARKTTSYDNRTAVAVGCNGKLNEAAARRSRPPFLAAARVATMGATVIH